MSPESGETPLLRRAPSGPLLHQFGAGEAIEADARFGGFERQAAVRFRRDTNPSRSISCRSRITRCVPERLDVLKA